MVDMIRFDGIRFKKLIRQSSGDVHVHVDVLNPNHSQDIHVTDKIKIVAIEIEIVI